MNFDHELRAIIEQHEGKRYRPYTDTVGKVTIGVGRNLTDVGVGDDEIDLMYENDIMTAIWAAKRFFPKFDGMDEVRQIVVLDMIFNLGQTRFAGFVNTIRYINVGDYSQAARNMLLSKWAKQVGNRAIQLADMMRTGHMT